MPIRVLLVSNPESVHTKTWIDGLRKCGIEVDILYVEDWIHTTCPTSDNLGASCRLLRIPSKVSLVKQSIRHMEIGNLTRDIVNHTRLHQSLKWLGKEVAHLFSEKSYDIIHSHGISSSLLLAHASGIKPYSGSAWGSDIYLAPTEIPYLIPLMTKALSDAAFIHVESELSTKRVIELAPGISDKLLVSTWGVDTSEYAPGLLFEETKERLGIQDGRIVLSMRALNPHYRIKTIIEAFSIVADSFKDIVLVISSFGRDNNSLVKLVKDFGLEKQTCFTGFIDEMDKRALLSNAHIYVQFPKMDGVSITVMEAMSSGVPIISSDVGETSVLVKDNLNGILVKDDKSESLADAIIQILQSPNLHASMSRESRKLVLLDHNRDRFFERFVEFVRSVI